ncbi:MAG: sigma-70 family RNA polymerase sigma factor [Chloroflexi bacterium]|nr:sigma-70 family RNA polymerase sigma factor [Chloroflexota bacterium]
MTAELQQTGVSSIDPPQLRRRWPSWPTLIAGVGPTNLAIRTNKQTPKGPHDALTYADRLIVRSGVVSRLIVRDPSALEEIYDRMSGRAFGLAYRILGNGAAAEDVVQDAFIWIWDNSTKIDPERGSVDGLLLTLVHRRAIDALRARSRHEALPESGVDHVVESEAYDLADQVQRTIEAEAITRAIEALSPEQSRMIDMAYFCGMTHAEISEQTNLPLGTVKSRLRLALGGLRKSFGLGESS